MYGININDNSSINLSISTGFRAFNLIYKGRGVDSSILFPYMDARRRTNTTMVSVTSETPPLFFALSFDGSNSRYITPIKYEVSGSVYRAHYLRDSNLVFYIFSTNIERSKSEYGIDIFDEQGGVVFSSDIKPLRVLSGKSFVFRRFEPSNPGGVFGFDFTSPVHGKKVALCMSTGVYDMTNVGVPDRQGQFFKGTGMRVNINGRLEYTYRNLIYFYNKDQVDYPNLWRFFGTSVGNPSYVLAIDVTNI